MRFHSRLPGCAALCALALAAPLRAQSHAPDVRAEATAGGTVEEYLRVLQVSGGAPLYPWSIRGFSPAEVDRLLSGPAAHPWSARLAAPARAGAQFHLLRPSAELAFNSAFPAGANDGAVWAGRGVTATATAGAMLRWGALSVRLEPVVYWTQNRSFELMSNGVDSLRFSDPVSPTTIDLPQRFGDGAFARVDPGQSTARLDLGPVALGFSTANEQWGPTVDLPLVLGTNAPGFPHAFLGTSRPLNVGIGRVHGRVEWGSLAQSDYSVVQGYGSRRLMTGLLAVFTPRGLDGLELGGARFFHTAWPTGGLTWHDLTEPFQSIFKVGLPEQDPIDGTDNRTSPDNQLASVFFRWTLPRAGFEAWGEYAREDHNWDLQDFLLQPDNSSGYTIGARKVWKRQGGSLLSLRAELLDTQPSNLRVVRNQASFYRHVFEKQGHTERGQVLGSPAAYGGGGSVLALDGYTTHGKWTVDWTRTRVRTVSAGAIDSSRVDVVHALGGQATLFHGAADGIVGVHGLYELNRNGGGDVFNLSATLGLRIGF